MSPRRRVFLGDFLPYDSAEMEHHARYLDHVDRLARDRARLLANRLEGDSHQAWALTHPDHRDRLVVVLDLGGLPPTVASMIVEPPA